MTASRFELTPAEVTPDEVAGIVGDIGGSLAPAGDALKEYVAHETDNSEGTITSQDTSTTEYVAPESERTSRLRQRLAARPARALPGNVRPPEEISEGDKFRYRLGSIGVRRTARKPR